MDIARTICKSENMARLNYHHLRHFREVAREGHLGRAAERLNVAQSALSVQIKSLEESLGFPLFERVSRGLTLTEAGRIALDHADQIFDTGDALTATLAGRGDPEPRLRLGAVSTLSRNFQMLFVHPLLVTGGCQFSFKSGNLKMLIDDLEKMALDVVLTTQVPQTDTDGPLAAQRIAQQAVQIHGHPDRLGYSNLSAMLRSEPVILPTDPIIRTGFQNLVAGLDVQPKIVAHVDDMAMVRLLARAGVGLAIAPAVVVEDEVRAGLLATAPYDLNMWEPFYAVTLPRKFPHPALAWLLLQHAG